MEEHVKLYKAIDCRVTDDLAARQATHRIIEEQNVGANDVSSWVPQHKIDLSLDALGHTDIIRVHPCNEVCIHVQCYLDPHVQRLW